MGSLGTNANTGALKLGSFSHNTSLRKQTTELKALGMTALFIGTSGLHLSSFALGFKTSYCILNYFKSW